MRTGPGKVPGRETPSVTTLMTNLRPPHVPPLVGLHGLRNDALSAWYRQPWRFIMPDVFAHVEPPVHPVTLEASGVAVSGEQAGQRTLRLVMRSVESTRMKRVLDAQPRARGLGPGRKCSSFFLARGSALCASASPRATKPKGCRWRACDQYGR
jgi:hypothetical protein